MPIAASRGTDKIAEAAFSILEDANRVFVSSEFVRLEVLPKPTFHKLAAEVAFYETFFGSLRSGSLVPISKLLIDSAFIEASTTGLSAVDALHVAAAKRGRCNEFITSEKREKPLFRVDGIVVRTIR